MDRRARHGVAYWLSVFKCVPGEEYVVASGTSRSVKDMLEYLLSLAKVKIECKLDETRLRPSDVVLLLGDPTKFKQATGWEPSISFEKMMQDLLNYWRKETSNRKAETSPVSS